MRNRILAAAAVLCVALHVGAARAQAALDLPQILERGHIRIALYNDLPPFSDAGKGLDLDIAKALAGKLGVKLSPVWFTADENVDDDLRNMVWRGHYLGIGPADVMMHAPVDPQYMKANKRVRFIAPYYREGFEIARNVERVPKLDTLEPFATEKIGVEVDTWADLKLLAADGGRYRGTVVHFKSPKEAIEALRRGEVSAVFGLGSQLRSALRGHPGFAIGPAPLGDGPGPQWQVGLAVKAEHEPLASRLEQAMSELEADGTLARLLAEHGVSRTAP